MLALRATRNSLVSTVPMILRGSIRPEESKVGVEMGPHPPPPAASRKPAISSAGSLRARGGSVRLVLILRTLATTAPSDHGAHPGEGRAYDAPRPRGQTGQFSNGPSRPMDKESRRLDLEHL